MYQHIDAKKLSFRLKAEGVLVDQKEGKHYKKTKFKQTYESSLSTVIIKNQSLPLIFTQQGTEICWQEVFTS